MNEKIKANILYGIIAVCITIMLILFSGTLSGTEDEIPDVAVTDSLFVPESVVKLTEQVTRLNDTMNVQEQEIDSLNAEITSANGKISDYEKISDVYALVISEKPEDAKAKLLEIDKNTLDEKAKILYDLVAKEID